MKEKLIRLKQLRSLRDDLAIRKKAAYEKYMSDNKDLFTEVDILQEQLTKQETEIRKIAVEYYEETGKKQQEYGVGVRILKKLEYEEAKALQWAKEHEMALNLDKKSFEKIARADPMDFIKINEVPQAILPFKIEIEEK